MAPKATKKMISDVKPTSSKLGSAGKKADHSAGEAQTQRRPTIQATKAATGHRTSQVPKKSTQNLKSERTNQAEAMAAQESTKSRRTTQTAKKYKPGRFPKAPEPASDDGEVGMSEDEEEEDAEDSKDYGGDKEGDSSSDAKFDTAEDEVYLRGFSSDEDSSDEEDASDEVGLDVSKLPTIAKDDATVKRKLEKAKQNAGPSEERGVISLSRLPHGFYEDQLRAYFSQFGEVTRLRVARNKKTGASKHYAFLEFDSLSVASIVADTMNNYLIHGHLLQCRAMPKEEVHPDLWIGANRKWRKVPRDQMVRREHNKPRTVEEQKKANKRLLKRQVEKKRKLEEAGIKYDFDRASYKKSKAV